jgi:2-keto-4-pentenoate hydratase/2-oxohepta-3-ene-1,7-dioic acid hydratase in catechol pathway
MSIYEERAMRICRYQQGAEVHNGLFFDGAIVPLGAGIHLAGAEGRVPPDGSLLDYLPYGKHAEGAEEVSSWIEAHPDETGKASVPTDSVALLRPIETPPKILLLAGNYAAHIEEEGSVAVERTATFPYVFMKPPTSFNDPGSAIPIPKVSPDHVDYEAELGVVMGRTARGVSEADALEYVAGYTIVNDVSDRQYKPNPGRKQREKDGFFDWLHGKWHDGFCPMGPCIASAASIPDPQQLKMKLTVNDEVRQEGSTAQMIFPVAAVIEFVSQWVTLEPGDIISTGTLSGVAMTTGRYLKDGDRIDVTIEKIGTLDNFMSLER